jgi:hypothetical protein
MDSNRAIILIDIREYLVCSSLPTYLYIHLWI